MNAVGVGDAPVVELGGSTSFVDGGGTEGVVTTKEGVMVCVRGVRSKNSVGDSPPITTGSPDTESDFDDSDVDEDGSAAALNAALTFCRTGEADKGGVGSASDDMELLLLFLDGKMRERETLGIWILRGGVDVDVGGLDAFNSDEKDEEKEKGEAKKALVFDARDAAASLSARDEIDEQDDLVER